jgi:hypothetical protein
MMRNIIGQTKSAFDLRDIMDNKKILLVNLSKGRLGDLNSKLLGMMFVMKFQAAAMSRSDTPEDLRQDFALYVDEFQNFSTDSFATIMSEARKYHLNLIVANQFTTQLTDEIRDAVFGNIGTIVAFRIGQNDVEALSRYFQPQFDGDDLLRVPNYNSIVRTLINGVPTQSFSMATLPPLGNPNPALAGALKQLSAAKYGKPKAVVEKAIFERLATQTPSAPTPVTSPFGATSGSGSAAPRPNFASSSVPAVPAPSASAPAGGGSFLDEWLAKQRAKAPMPSLSPARSPLPNGPAPAPFAPPQPKPVAAPGDASAMDGGNVSSAQLDQQEIDDIAKQLKKGLKGGADPKVTASSSQAVETAVTPEIAPQPVAPAPPAAAPAEKPTEGVLHLQRKAPTPTPDDTIFIDSDGQLHLRGATPDNSTKES